jgi:NAD(P)H dehydrogenase (quinone)
MGVTVVVIPVFGGSFMRALVVYCHPVEGSLCSAIRDAALTGLRQAGHDVSVIDLAADDFDPVMPIDEWQIYMDRKMVQTPEIVRYIEMVLESEILVFVYPTWWSGLPAQLKGWLERVLVAGVAFRFTKSNRVRPGLTQLRRIHVISTYGSPKLYVRLVNDNGRRILTRALRLCSAGRTRTSHQGLYSLDTSTVESREQFLRAVEKKMSTL